MNNYQLETVIVNEIGTHQSGSPMGQSEPHLILQRGAVGRADGYLERIRIPAFAGDKNEVSTMKCCFY